MNRTNINLFLKLQWEYVGNNIYLCDFLNKKRFFPNDEYILKSTRPRGTKPILVIHPERVKIIQLYGFQCTHNVNYPST